MPRRTSLLGTSIFIAIALAVFLPKWGHGCFAQILVSTTVIDHNTRAPLEYVNVVLKDKNLGTLSDENGRFEIECQANDSLILSHVGYRRKVLSAIQLSSMVELQPQTEILSAVQINSSRRVTHQKLGFESTKDATFMTGVLQYALFIENPEKMIGTVHKLLYEFGYSLHREKDDRKAAQVRVRMYQADSISGTPGTDLLRDNNIFLLRPNQRKLTVDLSSLNIAFPQDGLFIGLDVLGIVDESGQLINYHISDVKKHLQIPLVKSVSSAHTYFNPTGQGWVKCQILRRESGNLENVNACFRIEVLY